MFFDFLTKGAIMTREVGACSSMAMVFNMKDPHGGTRKVTWRGRTMDFLTPLATHVVPHNRGENCFSYAPGKLLGGNTPQSRYYANGEEGFHWTSRIGYLGLGALGNQNIIDGMNEAGFVFGGNTLLKTVYQTVQEGQENMALSAQDIGAYVQSTCEKVRDVAPALKAVVAWRGALDNRDEIAMPLIHFTGIDEDGENVVVEYVPTSHDDDESCLKTNIDDALGFLTNDPEYESMLDAYRATASLNPDIPQSFEVNGKTVQTYAIGSGLAGMPGGYGPVDRFNRLGTIARSLKTDVFNNVDAEARIWDMIQSVWVPNGLEALPVGDKTIEGYTRWAVNMNLTDREFTTMTYLSRGTDTPKMRFKLSDYDFSPGTPHTPKPIYSSDEEMAIWTAEYNDYLAAKGAATSA